MTPERWKEIERLYQAALEREPDDRAIFLEEACAGDEALRREVESLLAYKTRAENFIESPALEVAAKALAQDQTNLAVGQAIGHYKIMSLLGAGGMGEVYLGEDTKLGRKVAIKLLPSTFTRDEERVRRFRQEARSASALNHPNIITIYEIGQTDDSHFIVTEFIEGETLRQQMTTKQIRLEAALDIATQVASALASAHAAGIVHRDIKPENIMVRPDGLVKVLDFGLAKLTERQSAAIDTQAPTSIRTSTEPGVVMGTVSYMSPEQARGLKVDGRTDIFSLGVVSYEMVSGRAPFEGETTSDVIVSILEKEPPPLARYSTEVPEALEWIVTKMLTKDTDARYQTAKELLTDLRRLKQQVDFEAELDRSMSADGTIRRSAEQTALAPARARNGEQYAVRTMSSAEYITGQIKNHKRSVGIFMALVVVTAAAIFFLSRHTPALTEKDTILLADFVNTTGDAIFDGALKQGLAVQLEQSPFLNIFADTRVRQTLRLMDRSPDDRVTKELAREICQRQGLKAFLAGSITNLGSHYVIALEAVNAQSGEEIAREQLEAESKEQVLKALSQASSKMREKLGESLSSIQKFDAPLEVTTSSLEALKAYSLGFELALRGKWLEAIPFYKRAVGLDPNFSYAYLGLAVQYYNTNQPELAMEYTEKAFALRDRVSEYEKLRILHAYYKYVTGEIDKAIEVQEVFKRSYPRDARGPANLSDVYLTLGQFEKAAEEARQAVSLNPNAAVPQENLGLALIGLSRFAEAREVFERALQQKLDATDYHTGLYQIAFVGGDVGMIKQQLDWARNEPDEYVAMDWQTQTAAFAGQYRQSQEFSRRAVDSAAHANAKGVAARYVAEEALRDSQFGNCQKTKADAAQALTVERNTVSLTRDAMALALCGDVRQAQLLIDELEKRYPKNTLINSLWLPVIRTAIEINRNNPAQAIELLESTRRYEGAAEFWPAYLRGKAYLLKRADAEAAAEFQRILDNRGQAPLSTLYSLAHLGRARATAFTGDTAKSRRAYQDFFALWKDADPDITILQEAKREYEKLK